MRAIIGGSGLSKMASLKRTRREVVRTPFGDPSCPLVFGELGGEQAVFLARHGSGHTIAPHEINYRANLWALKQVGATHIVAVAAVGGIDPNLQPGDLVLPEQLIDYSYGRAHTFFEGPDQPVTHIDFTQPYDPVVRDQLLVAAQKAGEKLHVGGVYGCTQGPRLETAAEVSKLARDGCTLVGMTGMPEAALARELDLPYACLSVVVNHAAGVGSSAKAISHDAINALMGKAMQRVEKLLAQLI